MDVRNCRRCGRIFQYNFRPICPKCMQQEEDEFELVRNYLRDCPGSSVYVISEKTGVAPGQILKFFRDGKLEIAEGMQPLLECEKCHKPIYIGRLCDECMGKLKKDVESVTPKIKQSAYVGGKSDAKMHLSKYNN